MSQRLVLHLEESYRTAGIPGNCDEIFGKFAREIGRVVGVPVLTYSTTFGETTKYPNLVSFLPDAARCEYVDSEGLMVNNSREKNVFKKALMLLD